MIEGLESIMENPHNYLENCIQNPLDEQKKDRLLSVRNMNDEELSYYKIYRHEMTIAFQAEKITDSIRVIDNLRQLTAIMPDVQSSIETIIDLNKSAMPIFQNAIDSIASEIKSRKVEVSKYNEELKKVKEICEQYNEDCIKAWKSICNNDNLDFCDFEKDFIRDNQDYDVKLKLRQQIMDSINSLKDDIEKRTSFKEKLEKCTKKINKFITI